MFIRVTSLVALVAVATSLSACSSTSIDEVEDEDASEDELRTSAVTDFTLSKGTGFRPPPAPGTCNDFGHYEVDLSRKTLDANACIEGRSFTVSRQLTGQEHKSVKSTLAKLRVANRPSSCPTDVPAQFLTVRRGASETSYVQARAACHSSDTPVTDPSITALLTLLEGLTLASPADNQGTHVCPAAGRTVNCMPRAASPFCNDIPWVRANCPNVRFVF